MLDKHRQPLESPNQLVQYISGFKIGCGQAHKTLPDHSHRTQVSHKQTQPGCNQTCRQWAVIVHANDIFFFRIRFDQFISETPHQVPAH